MITKSKVPQIRFKGFKEEWTKNKLKELTDILRCGIASTPQYVDDGVVFLYSQNVTNSGKINLEKFNYISEEYYKKISKNAKLLKGDILYTRVGAGFGNSTVFPYDGDYGVYVSLTHIRTNKNLNNKFLNHLLNSPICKNQAENGVFQGGGVPNLNVKIVENFNIVYPKIEDEQRKIGNYFQQLDKLIEQKEKKYQKLKQFKKAMLDKMFPKNGADIPEIRFKGFSEKWKFGIVSDLLIERNIQMPKNEQYPLMAFVAYKGVTHKGDRYNREFLVNDEENKKYKQTELGDFIYSSNNLETGSIGLNNYGCATISPVYSIFKMTECGVSNFVGCLLVRKHFINQMIKWRQGVVYGQWRIHEIDFLKIEVKFPTIEEQTKIGNYFQKLDKQIDLQQKELEKLKNIKKASLSKMFV